MTYKDFQSLKYEKKFSVGKFSDNLFAFETKSGYGCVPEYRKLSKAEFNTFDIWRNDREKINDILKRPIFCSGYEGETDFDEREILK